MPLSQAMLAGNRNGMDTEPVSALISKLSRLGPLTSEERSLVEAAPLHIREFGPDQDLLREGDRPTYSLFLLEGFCCRYKSLADGRRQILAFSIAGDFLDLPGYLLREQDHSI